MMVLYQYIILLIARYVNSISFTADHLSFFMHIVPHPVFLLKVYHSLGDASKGKKRARTFVLTLWLIAGY